MKKVGDYVIYVDPKGIEHDALVTIVWSDTDVSRCINLVYVSDNPGEEDSYGRQTKHITSVQHQSCMQGVPGNYWKG